MCILRVANAAVGRRWKACAWSRGSASEASVDGVTAQCSRTPHPQPEQTCSAVHEVSAARDTAATETSGAA